MQLMPGRILRSLPFGFALRMTENGATEYTIAKYHLVIASLAFFTTSFGVA